MTADSDHLAVPTNEHGKVDRKWWTTFALLLQKWGAASGFDAHNRYADIEEHLEAVGIRAPDDADPMTTTRVPTDADVSKSADK